MASKTIELVLRMAIMQGGKVDYNPDMYELGFADNITPSNEFNEELKKYGKLSGFSGDEYGLFYGSWSSFTIDERGRQYIKNLDRQKDGPFKIKKTIRFLFYSFLIGFCLPIAITIGIEIGIAWLICNINAHVSYSWLAGIFHGLFFIPNYVRHLFDQNILFYAEIHTISYTIFYWLTIIFIIFPQHYKSLCKLTIELIKDWIHNRI